MLNLNWYNFQQIQSLLQEINELLAPDGYELFQQEELSGRPIFAARKIAPFNPYKSSQLTKISEFDHENPQPLLRALARLFASEGSATEVAILANASASIGSKYDDFGEEWTILYLQIPMYLYNQVSKDISNYEDRIVEKLKPILRAIPSKDAWIHTIRISPEFLEDPNWQEKAKAWLAGSNITNQGRVRSDNIASRSCDGLLFRSQPEIFLYQALKSLGVSFAPLPVFVRGGAEYKRIEPDFIIIKDGIVMIVEVDGDTVHQETPAEAHARTTMLVHEGVHVERIRASECDTLENAKKCALNLMQVLKKLKSAK